MGATYAFGMLAVVSGDDVVGKALGVAQAVSGEFGAGVVCGITSTVWAILAVHRWLLRQR